MATTVRVPRGLGVRGTTLWRDLHKERDDEPFPAAERILVEEACRMADRLEGLNRILIGEASTLVELVPAPDSDTTYVLVVSGALSEARQQANVLKQIIAALRLPDDAGERPQRRGARGAYQPRAASPKTVAKVAGVSSLDRARAAKQA